MAANKSDSTRPKTPRKPKTTSRPRPSTNGKPRHRRERPFAAVDDEALKVGRCAYDATAQPLAWHWAPWIARGVLTFVVGQPGCGKSTFLAYLCSQAVNVVYLPGHEEPFDQMTLPRLRAHGVDLAGVQVLDGRPFHLRANLDLLTRVARARRASLIVLDPIDSYVDEGVNENDGQAVRQCLEAAAALAEATGAAVVGARHPGKDPLNVCPGSRAWRAVPRAIVELIEEETSSRQRFLRPYKYSLGEFPAPLAFGLQRDLTGPPVFTPLKPVAAELAELARDVPDRLERLKIESACDLLRHLLKEGRMEAHVVFKWAEAEKLSEHTVRRAAKLVGIVYERSGFGLDMTCHWSLPKPQPAQALPGGGCVPRPLATNGRKPAKQAARPLVATERRTHPPPSADDAEPTGAGV